MTLAEYLIPSTFAVSAGLSLWVILDGWRVGARRVRAIQRELAQASVLAE